MTTTSPPARGATRQVELRPLASADKHRLSAWLEPGEAELWLASVDGDAGRQGWIVELSGAAVGLAGFFDVDRGHQRCGWLYHPASSDVGLDSYVHYWALEYVFEGLKFAKLWSEAPAASATSESFGFTIEARLRGHVIDGGERADMVRLGILAGDWRAERAAMAARLQALGFEVPAIG